jgi:hypothetical protein
MAKKTIINGLLLALLLTYCVSLHSCQKDGVYYPKQKMGKIYEDSFYVVGTWNPETGEFEYEEIIYPKQLTQVWSWNNNNLSKIAYHWGKDDESRIYATDNFFYDKNRVIRIEHDDNKYYTKITYDGSKYKKIETYINVDNKLWLTVDFTYENKKISKVNIVETLYDSGFKNVEQKLLSNFLPKETVSKIVKNSEKITNSKSTNSVTYNIGYTYNEDNIKESITNIDYGTENLKITTTYLSYDNKHNPFFGRLDAGMDIEYGYFLIVSSKNNPLQLKSVFLESGADEKVANIEYTYKYDKKFPIEITPQITFEGDEDDTWIAKTYFEYK